MKLARKPARKTSLTPACPCYDPIVFGHILPCPRWESPPTPAGASLHAATVQLVITETAHAMQRLRWTAEQIGVLMREVSETAALQEAGDAATAHETSAVAASSHSSPPPPPGRPWLTGPPGGITTGHGPPGLDASSFLCALSCSPRPPPG